MHVNLLLLLATLLLMSECDGQKDSTNSGKVPKNSGKVPKDSGKVPTKTGKVPTNSGKVPTNSGKVPSDPGKMPKSSGEVPTKIGKVPTNNSRQLLEGLFAVALKANKPVKKDGTKKPARLNALKSSLAYAVNFMAKRGKISLENPRGEKEKEPKAILIELITIYNELQSDIENEIKSWQKSDQKGKGKNGQKGKKENGQKEQRFLRFVARSLEIEWDANAFLGGQDNEDEDLYAGEGRDGYNGINFNHPICYIIFILDDANRRRRRRKRIPSPNAVDVTCLSLLFLGFAIYICCKSSMSYARASHAQAQANAFGTMPSQNELVVATAPQIQSALAAFEAITSIPYEASVNEEENSCAICLDPIENGTMVKPLPCKHIFHNKCIYSWIKQHITCPMCRDALSMTKAVRVSSNGQANGATNGNGGGSARGTATVANPREVVIDMPSADGQNGENAVGTGTDGAEINRHNNGTENGPN
ncbi:hypothetical protein niasHT_031411 [Heterodera trifolii]|uniref:RING-type domain-containing protein n=1 Tax=Heterodera trifolii TaxID=157864 RepID=A0ABD2HQ26_9BILA